MDPLDSLLLESWHNVSNELQNKPWKLARRMERVQRKELRRPVRAWAVALRANDARIGGEDLYSPGGDEGAIERCRRGYTHPVMLRGRRVRELCKARRIDWPGVWIDEAARQLGRDVRTVYRWSDTGALRYRKEHEPGRRGKASRWVWSDTAIDPQANDGRGPWSAWGSLWQGLSERIPEDFEQRVERVPRLRDSAKDRRTRGDAWPGRYRGWDWRCPGRRVADGTVPGRHVPCGRVCKKLWLPLPAWTIGDALGGRAGAAWEAMPRFERGAGRRGFACARCWGLRFDCPMSNPQAAWNRFVSVVSGGLLYGREVDRGLLWQAV
ncbi:MAG: hypothetical protein ACE37H_14110 [Phycisphaeraceae bacterium]